MEETRLHRWFGPIWEANIWITALFLVLGAPFIGFVITLATGSIIPFMIGSFIWTMMFCIAVDKVY
jgi:hypothetical protein